MKTPKALLPFIILIILSVTPVHASPALNLTAATDKQTYQFGENVSIYANLTSDGSPIQHWLVALQIEDPGNKTLVLRTLQTIATPTAGWTINITVAPCNQTGGPKDTFQRGGFAYFKEIVYNYLMFEVFVLATINIYDGNGVPLVAAPSFGGSIPPLTAQGFITSFLIPAWASAGNATVYASAYSDLPKLDGIPYCPEASAPFKITGSTQGSGATETTNGTYSLTFRLPSYDMEAGTFKAYVTSGYGGTIATNNTTFEVMLLGDVTGPEGVPDGIVNIFDYMAVVDAWLSTPGDPNWNPDCDFNNDNVVNIFDYMVIVDTWLYGT